MRQITITFKQEDKEVVAGSADFGNRDEASELENKLGDASQALIATALRKLPALLVCLFNDAGITLEICAGPENPCPVCWDKF